MLARLSWGFATLVFIILLGVCAMALWYRLPIGWQGIGTSAWLLASIGLITFVTLSSQSKTRKILAALIPLAAITIWWSQIQPSNARSWTPELAQSVTGDVRGSQVTLHNVRDFDWHGPTSFTPRWITETYDLEKLDTLEVFLSYWGNPAIAHTLVSFGFSDGQQIVFSVEIRKEDGEDYSELGGFFKSFELSLIAATERDILFLRTNARDPIEDVYRYVLDVQAEPSKELFLSYVALANDLAERPRWYNTATTNCTTVIYRLVKSFNPDVSFDWRILVSGYLPEYFAENGHLKWPPASTPLRATAHITPLVQGLKTSQGYSEAIRATQ